MGRPTIKLPRMDSVVLVCRTYITRSDPRPNFSALVICLWLILQYRGTVPSDTYLSPNYLVPRDGFGLAFSWMKMTLAPEEAVVLLMLAIVSPSEGFLEFLHIKPLRLESSTTISSISLNCLVLPNSNRHSHDVPCQIYDQSDLFLQYCCFWGHRGSGRLRRTMLRL
ncbi:hypothetical protein LshimejAT787_1204320 [Lyophyllum shimeji]|uniref:Uncharacterized protein n=1 Tax=Lyophyllum shimeji TaxID=47721 RepID=A0A9P3URT6_LYOSH|nr:hypothetical protein LshimejAT787_1204320 [Lyophyllum shimeji]